jgi:hypothetical protein
VVDSVAVAADSVVAVRRGGGEMDLSRLLRHWRTGASTVSRAFPAATLARIETIIGEVERTHAGQIRFAVEADLPTADVLAGVTGRERGLEVFANLRVWDTEHNNGVLIYLLLADRDVEIVADRGIHARAGAEAWEAVCRSMEACFRDGRFEEGAVTGIRAVGALIATHFPPGGAGRNELPDAPVLL